MKQSGSGSNQECPTISNSNPKSKPPRPCDLPFAGFFDPMLYHPDILDNSQNSPRKFTTTLLASQNIRTIKVSPYLIEVFLKTRQQRQCVKEITMMKNWNFKDQELGQFISKSAQAIATYTPSFVDRILSDKNEWVAAHLENWLKNMETKNYIAWYLPVTQASLRLRSMIFSKKALSLLGYSLEESAIDLTKYHSHCFDLLDNNTYREIFSIYTEGLQKYLQADQTGQSQQQIEEESLKIVTNVFMAKNERPVKAQVRISMPTAFILCVEILKVIKRDPSDKEVNLEKVALGEQAEMVAIKSLEYVARIKSMPSQDETLRMCSYVVLGDEMNDN